MLWSLLSVANVSKDIYIGSDFTLNWKKCYNIRVNKAVCLKGQALQTVSKLYILNWEFGDI